MRGRRGSVAVLLMLIMASVLIIVGVLFEGACSAAAKSVGEGSMDLAGRSVLSQYHRGIQKDYGIFAVKGDESFMAGDLEYYMKGSLEQEEGEDWGKEGIKRPVLRLLDLHTTEVSADSSQYSLLISENLELQILSYMKYRALFSGLWDFAQREATFRQGLEESGNACNMESMQQQAAEEAERRQAEEDSRQEEESESEKEERKRSQQEVKKLKEQVKEIKNRNGPGSEDLFSGRVLRNRNEIKNLPSHLTECSGGPDFSSLYSGGVALFLTECRNNLYISEYIGQNFSNCVDKRKGLNTFFQNEQEYILWGSLSDESNGKKTRYLLFTVRSALNLAHIYSDPQKRSLTLDAAIAIAPGPLAPAVQFLLSALWSAAESESDLELLYKGETVPFVKQRSDWKLDLDGLLKGEAGVAVTPEKNQEVSPKKGQNYSDYMGLFMLMGKRETQLMRALDLMQLNTKLNWDKGFFAKDYATGFAAKVTLKRRTGLQSPFDISGGYEIEKIQRY